MSDSTDSTSSNETHNETRRVRPPVIINQIFKSLHSVFQYKHSIYKRSTCKCLYYRYLVETERGRHVVKQEQIGIIKVVNYLNNVNIDFTTRTSVLRCINKFENIRTKICDIYNKCITESVNREHNLDKEYIHNIIKELVFTKEMFKIQCVCILHKHIKSHMKEQGTEYVYYHIYMSVLMTMKKCNDMKVDITKLNKDKLIDNILRGIYN